MTREDLEKVYGLKQKADGYNNGWTGGRNMNGSFIPKGEGFGSYTKTIYEPTFLQDYREEKLTGAYDPKNQYKG